MVVERARSRWVIDWFLSVDYLSSLFVLGVLSTVYWVKGDVSGYGGGGAQPRWVIGCYLSVDDVLPIVCVCVCALLVF